jgi:hypothetical protein
MALILKNLFFDLPSELRIYIETYNVEHRPKMNLVISQMIEAWAEIEIVKDFRLDGEIVDNGYLIGRCKFCGKSQYVFTGNDFYLCGSKACSKKNIEHDDKLRKHIALKVAIMFVVILVVILLWLSIIVEIYSHSKSVYY